MLATRMSVSGRSAKHAWLKLGSFPRTERCDSQNPSILESHLRSRIEPAEDCDAGRFAPALKTARMMSHSVDLRFLL